MVAEPAADSRVQEREHEIIRIGDGVDSGELAEWSKLAGCGGRLGVRLAALKVDAHARCRVDAVIALSIDFPLMIAMPRDHIFGRGIADRLRVQTDRLEWPDVSRRLGRVNEGKYEIRGATSLRFARRDTRAAILR